MVGGQAQIGVGGQVGGGSGSRKVEGQMGGQVEVGDKVEGQVGWEIR